MRRFLRMLLALALTACCLSPAVAVEKPLSPAAGEYEGFTDVAETDWFAPYVEVCVSEGLMEGAGEGKFEPRRVLSVEEALVLAARIAWRADGETGELPAGGTADEFWGLIYGDDDVEIHPEQMERYRKLAQGWSWDGVFYITKRFREVYGPGTTYWYNFDGAAKREEFFRLLSLPVKVLDLPQLNEVGQLPDVEDRGEYDGAGVYRLYEAGIAAGVDEYGSAALGGSLTRAEAAAMAARVLEPSLRLTGFAPTPLPADGYTLTYLMDGNAGWQNYPLAFVEYTDEKGEYANCFLTLDGKKLGWPEGTEEGVPSFGLEQRGEYVWMQPWNRSNGDYWGHTVGLMDGEGNMVIPFERCQDVWPTGDGHFIRTVEAVSETEYSKTDVFLLSPDGQVEAQLPSYYGTPDNTWREFNEGVCPWEDEESGLWGYVDAAGNWAVEPVFSWAGRFQNGYAGICDQEDRTGLMNRQGEMVIPFGDYDTSLRPVSQRFDWAGQIGPDGRGFVGMDEKIYRIQFFEK